MEIEKNSDLFDRYYDALLAKDDRFEGIFFTAVKTTGIFCRPTCTARKPKKENVDFFSTVEEPILKGYRACKVCRPLGKIGEIPNFIKEVLAEIEDEFALKLKDSYFLGKGIEPNKIRRWFLKNRGMTFQHYQRILRLKIAFKKIQAGESVISVAFNSGYDSLSGFNEAFKKFFGVSPSVIKENSFELARGSNEETLAVGMAEKAKEFVATGSEIYHVKSKRL